MTATATSLTLLQRARNRDDDAWQRLVELYAPLVRHWLRLRVPASDVDDLVQESFAAVAQSLDRFRRDQPGDSFRGWLKGIVRHVVSHHFRKRPANAVGGTDAQMQIQALPAPEADWADDDPDQIGALYKRSLDLVRGEFESSTWQMFWRVTIDGRPAAQVAAEMNATPAAIRMAKSRVLRRLREELGDLLEE